MQTLVMFIRSFPVSTQAHSSKFTAIAGPYTVHQFTTNSSFHPSLNMPQDMPPVGGYEPVQYRRNFPARGFRPVYYLLGVGAIMTYGFYKYGQGVREAKYVCLAY